MHVTCHLELHTTPDGLAWLIANANAATMTPNDYISMLFNDAYRDAESQKALTRENFTSHIPSAGEPADGNRTPTALEPR